MFTHFSLDFATLLSIMNPVIVIPVYLKLTGKFEPAERERVLRRAMLVSALFLLIFLVVGQIVLNALGVSLDAFRIAGGLVLLLLGMSMIFDVSPPAEPDPDEPTHGRDIAVFPLAMPLTAGSGAIMAVVLLTENELHDIPAQAGTALTMFLVLAINYVVLKAAAPIHRLLGSTGAAVVGRITGLVLTALAVQAIIIGVQNSFPALSATPALGTKVPSAAPAK
jgi:multiple antibiotic resistance protein